MGETLRTIRKGMASLLTLLVFGPYVVMFFAVFAFMFVSGAALLFGQFWLSPIIGMFVVAFVGGLIMYVGVLPFAVLGMVLFTETKTCDYCGGSGFDDGADCYPCGGSGVVAI